MEREHLKWRKKWLRRNERVRGEKKEKETDIIKIREIYLSWKENT